jgi:hypothetical protein
MALAADNLSRRTFLGMYVLTEADAAAIREVYERDGKLSAAIETVTPLLVHTIPNDSVSFLRSGASTVTIS